MRRYEIWMLIGFVAVLVLPVLRAQQYKADHERAMAEIKKLGARSK